MNNLDDLSVIKNLDTSNALNSLKKLPDQCEQAWKESTTIVFSQKYFELANIIICGMGGSSYGGRIVKSLYDGAQFTKIPIELVNNYYLPGYVNEKSLIILSSYSGSTEEIFSVAQEAKQKKALICGITSGGKLADFLKTNSFPIYKFDPIYNPSNQPRIGVGYMVMGLLGILSKLNRTPIGKDEVIALIKFLHNQSNSLDETVVSGNNFAKKLATKFRSKIPIFVVADFLEGASYAVRNPLHETAKQFALYFVIPDLNHHLMEGLSYPSEVKKYLTFVFIESKFYHPRNIKRIQLTKDVIEKNEIDIEIVKLNSNSPLTQVMEFIQLGAWISFYLAILHEVDPSKIPWVDYFKNQLNKQ